MSAPDLVAGIDVGGTRTKVGLVDVVARKVVSCSVVPTEHLAEGDFLAGIARELARQGGGFRAAGTSIGSYVFADGSIDGMSSFVPFLVHGYPLRERLEGALGVPCRVDNDARLIGLAEALDGEGRGFRRVLTLTLGTGVGVGLCEGGRPVGADSYMHLAGHLRVREGGDVPSLDDEPCYCGLAGCFESTCSGTSLQKVVHAALGPEVTNPQLFQRAQAGDESAQAIVDWYLDMLLRALNQYVYLYCPDCIVLGGGVAAGLAPYRDHIQAGIVASVYEGQTSQVRVTRLRENAGVLGAGLLFSPTAASTQP